MRGLVLAVAQQPPIRAALTTGPGRLLARRFVAGETLDEALSVTRRLITSGAKVSLDFLGEEVSSVVEAERAAVVYLDTVAALARSGLQASISVKPSQFGVDVDFDRCRALIASVAAAAAMLPATVRLDMESSHFTDMTIELWHALHLQHPNVGLVLQAALLRTSKDMPAAVAAGATIRLCKGAYAEPARIAYSKKADVDINYEQLMRQLLEAAAHMPPSRAGNEPRAAIATHDGRLVDLARRMARHLRLGPDRFEFQMLYGVRRDLQASLLAHGEPLRVYVPWGPAWYPYLSRRLAERPANVIFVGRALLAELLALGRTARRPSA